MDNDNQPIKKLPFTCATEHDSDGAMKKLHNNNKEYKFTIHQLLCVTAVNFQKETIYGFTELHILPLVPFLSHVRINCKQCRVYRVCVRGSGLDTWLEAAFSNEDPGIDLCPNTEPCGVEQIRNSLQNAIFQTEADHGGGEIFLRLPSETMALVEEKKTLRLSIEFVLEKPCGGVHFVNPDIDGSPVERRCHMFTYKYGNSSRLWFPCIDTPSEVCTWKIEVTTDIGMTVVCPGDLAEKVYTNDEERITHHFMLATPTSACNIGMVVGPFEVVLDPDIADVMCFVLPGLVPLVKHSTSFLANAFEFFEENLNMQYPFSTYKMIFVDEAFMDAQSFTSMAILNTNLLHPPSIIDQTFITRKILVYSLAEQFFGMFVSIQSWADFWLIQGIVRYLAGLFLRKHFGINEYKFWLHKKLTKLCDYELNGPGLPPLYPFPLASINHDNKQEAKKESAQTSPQAAILQHPHNISNEQLIMLKTKSHLVLRIIELRIGQDLLLQSLNKALSLASSAAAKCTDFLVWNNMLLSTNGFLKTISTVSGKDINSFLDQWICHSGVAKFSSSFSFNRKRNIIELEITQCAGKGCQKYVGPMSVCIQELDGSFSHTVQVEDVISTHELPCHSKSRRNKKKKIPLVTGEEVDMDLSVTLDSDSPVLWVRIDPDMTWSRHVTLQQPDYMWQYQLRYERDITSQIEAVKALVKYPCAGTRNALIDTVNNPEAFFKVRIEAAECLVKLSNMQTEIWDGNSTMIEMYEKMFGSNTCSSIPKFNDFSNFINYFIQKALPTAISNLKNVHSQCSKETLQFLFKLLKYNDNRFNQFSDSYYVSSLVDALRNVIGPALHLASSVEIDQRGCLPVDEDMKSILSEATRRLNMDKILPSFRYAITCSCLRLIRCLQANGHIPAEPTIFKKYSQYGLYEDIRITALEMLCDFAYVHSTEDDFNWLLDVAENDRVPRIRHHVITCLANKTPSLKPAYTSTVVKRIWKLINSGTSNSYLLRCDYIELYTGLWRKLTSSNSACFMHDEEPSKKRKRLTSKETSPSVDNLDGLTGSEVSLNNKLKLKIKFGGDDTSHDSGSDFPVGHPKDAVKKDEHSKKQKKKKKKRHKEKKEKSLTEIPGTHVDLLDDRLGAHSLPLLRDSRIPQQNSDSPP